VPGSAPVDAFLVTDVDSGERTLVDARHAGAFGIPPPRRPRLLLHLRRR